MALVTNSAPDLQREKVQGVGLARYFTAIVVSGEIGLGKPDPHIFARALARCTAEPAAAAMVGNDLIRDIKSSPDAGLRGVWVNRRDAQRAAEEPQPDAEVSSVVELLHQESLSPPAGTLVGLFHWPVDCANILLKSYIP